MSNQSPPRIEFPCTDYPIKVMGDAGDELQIHVVSVFSKLVDDFDVETLRVRESAQGRYQSITVSINATGETQLQAIFAELKLSNTVKMVL
jgi:hypothetical protein